METEEIKEMRRQKFLNKQKLGIGNLNGISNTYNLQTNNNSDSFRNSSPLSNNDVTATTNNQFFTTETKKISYKKAYESQKDKEFKKSLFEVIKTLMIIICTFIYLFSSKYKQLINSINLFLNL